MTGEGEEVFLGHELQARASSVVTVLRYIGLGILVLSRCRGKVRESGVCEQFAHVEQFALIIVRVIIRVVLGEFCLGELRLSMLGLGELLTYSALADFAPTTACWLIMRCPLFTINFSLFTSPSFQAHNDTDSGNTIVDGRDYSLSIAIQRLTTSVCPKYI